MPNSYLDTDVIKMLEELKLELLFKLKCQGYLENKDIHRCVYKYIEEVKGGKKYGNT